MSEFSFHDRESSAKDMAGDWNPLFDDFPSDDSDFPPVNDDSDPGRPLSAPPPHPAEPKGAHSLPPNVLSREADEPAVLFNLDAADSIRAGKLDSLLSVKHPTTTFPKPEPPAVARTVAPPKVGDTICGFYLISTLGKGAFATVYLAEQIELGRRLVALKVSKAEGEEPQILARLQHTHIVPIFSVTDDPVTGLRLLCMPYLGGANLAQILEAAVDRMPNTKGSQKSLVAALDEVNRRFYSARGSIRSVLESHESRGLSRSRAHSKHNLPRSRILGQATWEPAEASSASPSSMQGSLSIWKFPTFISRLSFRVRPTQATNDEIAHEEDFDQPARLFLREADSIQAAVWVIARLAEGLEHAHSRGMLHRDLKPSNILVARDGTPMLLDFNLSTEIRPKDVAEGEKAMLGGTLPYMSPEHLKAFNPTETTNADAVTERSDIYALGLIFYEMLAGEHPFPEPPGRRCLIETLHILWEQRQDVPAIRDARPDVPWSIDAILQKCLAPDPANRYASARELSEDLTCHLDDRPLKHTWEPSLRERLGKWKRRNPKLCGIGSIALFSTVGFLLLGLLVLGLFSNLRTLAARVKLQTFESNFIESRFLLNLQSGPAEHLKRGVVLAGKTLESEELGPDGEFQPSSWVNLLTSAEQKKIREQTSELMLLHARSKIDLAQRSGDDRARLHAIREGIHLLENAERIDPRPPAVLYSDLARYHAAIGRADLAEADRLHEGLRKPATLRDFQLLGSSLLAQNQIPEAISALQRAIDLDPKAYWAWFTLGHCHFEQARYLEAAGDFAVCAALEPRFPWSFLNRGLALARSGRLIEARDCYLQAIDRNPRFAEAWVNLALTLLELNELKGAERAIEMTQSLGRNDISLLAVLGEIKARLGKTDEAESLFGKLLARNPDDVNVLNARGIFRIKTNPEAANDDFTKVLHLDPMNARALFGLALMDRKTDPEAALKEVELALKTDPGFLDALQLRAVTKARLGIVSAADDADKLARIETSNRLYNAACAMSLLSEKVPDAAFTERALDYLERALELGFDLEVAANDQDLNALSSTDRYKRMLRGQGSLPRRG